MEKALEIAFIDLSVPLWHIIVYAALLSFFMLTWRMKAFFATSILFILYWGYLFRPHFLATVGTGFLPVTAFALFGLALAGLLIYVLLLDLETEPVANYPGREVAHLRKSLLKRIDKMEKSLVNEAQAQLKDENWKFESIQKEMDSKLLNFRAQLEEESAGVRELEIREIQERLNSRIQELESQIRSKEELLAAREREKEDLGAQSRASLESLQARLREREEALEDRKAEVAEAEKRQIAKIDELENRLTAQLSQLVTRSCELEEIRSASESRIASLEAELRQKTDALSSNRDSVKEVEESLKLKIQMLERQLEEKAETLPSLSKDLSFESLLAEFPPSSGSIREKINAVLEPEMEKLWADLVERGMLSEEREKEVQIIQQKMN